MTDKYPFVPYTDYREYPPEEMKRRAKEYYEDLKRRRTIRQFSDREVAREVIEYCLRTAGTAPSGANKQPWRFVVVSDPKIKKAIREKAEEIERDFYKRRAPKFWLDDLAPLGTDEVKDYLEVAPYSIVIFEKSHDITPDGKRVNHYYVPTSVGIATGFLISALHHAGLATLTHTPSPMGFLNKILKRPSYERAFLVIVVGYPASDAQAPDIGKKPLEEIATFV